MGWRVEEEGERRQGAGGRGGGLEGGGRAGTAVVEGDGEGDITDAGLHPGAIGGSGLPHNAPMSSGAAPPFLPAESRTPREVNAPRTGVFGAKSARGEKGVREVARGIGAVGWVWRAEQSCRGVWAAGVPFLP